MSDGPKIREMWELAEDFDDDLAKSMLEVQFDKLLHPQDAVEKSLYNFDLDTPEGIDRLLELLPIMDPEIINEVYQEIFPQYPVATLAPRVARLELRGYLMDYLDGAFQEAENASGGAEEPTPEPSPTEGSGEEAMAQEAGTQDMDQAPTDEAGAEPQ